jgi:hypothetical protein
VTLLVVAMLALGTIAKIRRWCWRLKTAAATAAAAETTAAFTAWTTIAITATATAKAAAAFTTRRAITIATAATAAKTAAAFTTRRAIAKTAAAAKSTAAFTTRRRTIAEITTRRTVAEITAWRTIAKVAARRTRCALGRFTSHFDVNSLRAFAAWIRFSVEFDFLPVHQSSKSGPLNSRDVNEYVGAARIRCNKAKSFCAVEEFDRAGLRHVLVNLAPSLRHP